MDKETAGKYIEKNLLTIYRWSLSKLYDKTEAEDLTQDIIYQVLKSAERLENDDAFYGFLWKIAENTFKTRLRKKKLDIVEWNQEYSGNYWMCPEEKCINEEELQNLRRELSLLTRQYREVTVGYYIHGKSCAELSEKLHISVEMVKYYLFKTRKILKEGIAMNREFGEMSYNPQIFRMDFWGNGDNSIYWKLFERKLPGNILLATYEKPLSLMELSVELGVSTVYLEDEVDILESHDIIKRIGDKYQTNIIIFSDICEKRIIDKCRTICEMSAQLFGRILEEKFSEMKKYEPYNCRIDDNSYKWIFSNLGLYFASLRIDEMKREVLRNLTLSNGEYGVVYGYDNDYENHCFNGIYGGCEDKQNAASLTVINYRLFQECQCWKPHNQKTIDAMMAAILGKTADEENDELIRMIEEEFIFSNTGELYPNFPVFTTEELDEIKRLLEPAIKVAYDCMNVVCDVATDILKNYVPKIHRDKCVQISYIRFRYDSMAHIMDSLIKYGYLIMPNQRANYCMFGVKK